ncbi:aminoglycoside phosphotransferase family protein [Shewanella olleyana]|uniref:phosphotransferase n=1 Tax=Shewanella olleyana TaxID=135626 RepID=UPI00200BD5B8|nr:phosphotransferase [Shewanella olleyana]MCL1067876.1 aminoglycoside phosphotransferase family protein [Shewanella olleyana]
MNTSPLEAKQLEAKHLENKQLVNKQQCWQQNDWPQNAKHWTEVELNKHNIRLIGELQQVKGWALGHVLRQSTHSGEVFFKATALLHMFSNEASLCAKLFELFPQNSAEVIAFDANKQWMLTKSFGEAFVDTVPLSDWSKPFAAFAGLQIESVKHIEQLESAGCIRREIINLTQQLSDIFQDISVSSQLPQDLDLSPENLQQVLSRLDNDITALSAYQLPNTLVHSDLHIENIAPFNPATSTIGNDVNNQHVGFIFFDWSDACISHPFIDGTYLFRMNDSPEKHTVINAYLSQWDKFGSKDELSQAWQLAEGICYAHQAVSYAGMLHILSKEETPELVTAFENAFRRFLIKIMN